MTEATSLGTRTGIVSRTVLLTWLALAALVLIVVATFTWPATGVVVQGTARGYITPTLAHVKEAPAVGAANVGALTSVREAGAPAESIGSISDTDVEAREGDR